MRCCFPSKGKSASSSDVHDPKKPKTTYNPITAARVDADQQQREAHQRLQDVARQQEADLARLTAALAQANGQLDDARRLVRENEGHVELADKRAKDIEAKARADAESFISVRAERIIAELKAKNDALQAAQQAAQATETNAVSMLRRELDEERHKAAGALEAAAAEAQRDKDALTAELDAALKALDAATTASSALITDVSAARASSAELQQQLNAKNDEIAGLRRELVAAADRAAAEENMLEEVTHVSLSQPCSAFSPQSSTRLLPPQSGGTTATLRRRRPPRPRRQGPPLSSPYLSSPIYNPHLSPSTSRSARRRRGHSNCKPTSTPPPQN